MLISKELERRMFLLADPETKWVQREPHGKESWMLEEAVDLAKDLGL